MENVQRYTIFHVTLVYLTDLLFQGKLFGMPTSSSIHLSSTSRGFSFAPPQPTTETNSSLSYRKPSSNSITLLFQLIFPPRIVVLRIVYYVGSISSSSTHFCPIILPRSCQDTCSPPAVTRQDHSFSSLCCIARVVPCLVSPVPTQRIHS